MSRLVARTERIDEAPDPLTDADRCCLLVSPTLALTGTGVARRIELDRWGEQLDRVSEVLAEIDIDDPVDRPGTGPVAFLALPFDRTQPTTVTVPASITGRAADGTSWRTEISGPGVEQDPGPAPRPAEPTSFTVGIDQDPSEWQGAVAEATRRIRQGQLDKVVLARRVEIVADQPLDRSAILSRLADRFPSAYLIGIGATVGASPELLVARHGDLVSAQPMAGTVPVTGDPRRDSQRAAQLLASDKDRAEHQITVEALAEQLLPFCSYLDAGAAPEVVGLANVAHLATSIRGRLSDPAATLLELVAATHPTPAVGGSPTPVALGLLSQLETARRGTYAGPAGWVDARGNGEMAVGVRTAEISGNRLVTWSGVGVVADSDPAAELAETRAKLQAVLGCVVRI